jgi:hypothetical protein
MASHPICGILNCLCDSLRHIYCDRNCYCVRHVCPKEWTTSVADMKLTLLRRHLPQNP